LLQQWKLQASKPLALGMVHFRAPKEIAPVLIISTGV